MTSTTTDETTMILGQTFDRWVGYDREHDQVEVHYRYNPTGGSTDLTINRIPVGYVNGYLTMAPRYGDEMEADGYHAKRIGWWVRFGHWTARRSDVDSWARGDLPDGADSKLRKAIEADFSMLWPTLDRDAVIDAHWTDELARFDVRREEHNREIDQLRARIVARDLRRGDRLDLRLA